MWWFEGCRCRCGDGLSAGCLAPVYAPAGPHVSRCFALNSLSPPSPPTAAAGDGRPPHPHLLRDQEGVRRGDAPAAHGRLARAVHPRRQIAARARLGALAGRRGCCGRCGEADGRLCGSLGCNERWSAGEHGAAATCCFARGLVADAPSLPPYLPQVLAEFKAGKHPIMIATDVAARGLGASPGTAPCRRSRACPLRLAWPCCAISDICACMHACRSSREGS